MSDQDENAPENSVPESKETQEIEPISETVSEVVVKDHIPATESDGLRSNLVCSYYGGSNGLIHKIHQKSGSVTPDDLINGLVGEIVSESDSMKGNELIVLEEGDARGSTIISSKRVSAMESAAKILHQKKIIDSEHSIDLDSPYIKRMLEYIVKRIHHVFLDMQLEDEVNDIFFSRLGEKMKDWKKEVRREFDELREQLKSIERENTAANTTSVIGGK